MYRQSILLAAAISLEVAAAFASASAPVSNTHFTAVMVKEPNPPGCLYSWPRDYTFEGQLTGDVLPAVPQENPPISARVYMYFQLKRPVSVCNFYAGSTRIPAYVNVNKIGMGTWAVPAYRLFMKKYGKYRILLTGSLSNRSLGSANRPGPILFLKISQFCYSGITENTQDVYQCLPWNTKP
ncbi:MAG: hypothetical protein ACRES7_08940 [Gammaproteobacteria bacterium]